MQLQVYDAKTKKRHTKTVPYVSDLQAEKDWLDFAAECRAGRVTSGITLSELIRRVYYEVLELKCKRQTLRGYRAAIRKIDETIGMIRLPEVTPYILQRWLNGLDLSPKTKRNYLSFLRRCLRVAITWGLIDRDPAEHLELPESPRLSVRVLSAEELPQFVTALHNCPASNYRAAMFLALCCGLRRGETCALLSEDYDSGVITVTKALYIDRGEVYCDAPKSRSAVRRVYVPEFLQPSLSDLSKEPGFLIKGADGDLMYPDNLWHWLHRFELKNGLPEVSYHSLRHTFAAILLLQKVPPSEISRALGHAQITTTLNLYAYNIAPESARIEAARSIDYIMTTSIKSPESLQSEAFFGGEGGIRTHVDPLRSDI